MYVNDIEVYRPFGEIWATRRAVVCKSRHGGPHRIQRGGFEAKYGDKLSSVLDIHYRKPTEAKTRVPASALGAQLQHDNVPGPLRINLGLRYRNNRYVLSTLDERGEYAPTYLDGQCYLTWDPDGYGPWEVQALGVYGSNDYSFLPATRETNIGTMNQAARLTVYYDGREESGYETGFGALAFERRTETTRIRWINSIFQTAESESFDVLGQYFLSELERDPGGDTFDEGNTFGVGGFLQHGRNQLWARVVSSALKGNILEQHHVEWGLKHRHRNVRRRRVRVERGGFGAGFFAPHPQTIWATSTPQTAPTRSSPCPTTCPNTTWCRPTAAPRLCRTRGREPHGATCDSCRRPGSSVVGVDAPPSQHTQHPRGGRAAGQRVFCSVKHGPNGAPRVGRLLLPTPVLP